MRLYAQAELLERAMERERDRDRQRQIHIHIHIHVHERARAHTGTIRTLCAIYSYILYMNTRHDVICNLYNMPRYIYI